MGAIDEFLRAHVSSGLLPGEQILGFGHLRCPIRFNRMGVPAIYVNWLAVATSCRLVMFRTEAGGMFGDKPEPRALETLVFSYDDLAQVRAGDVEGLAIHSGGQATKLLLLPHPHCGPMPAAESETSRFDIFPSAHGLDDQRRFQTVFPRWLEQQVAAGAFPMAREKRAAIAARLVADRAAHAEELRRRDEVMRKASPIVLRLAIAIVVLGLAGTAASVAIHGVDNYRFYSEAHGAENAEYALERAGYARDGLVSAALGSVGLLVVLAAGAGLVAWDRMRAGQPGRPGHAFA